MGSVNIQRGKHLRGREEGKGPQDQLKREITTATHVHLSGQRVGEKMYVMRDYPNKKGAKKEKMNQKKKSGTTQIK